MAKRGARNNSKSGNRGSAGLNKKRGEEFLIKNANRHEVKLTGSGLQYEIIRKGNGKAPDINSKVKIDQRALSIEGTVLDDTYKSGRQDILSVEEAIPGYAEALMLMNEGARYKFVVPHHLAWGKKGSANGKIGPYATLIFDVALHKVF